MSDLSYTGLFSGLLNWPHLGYIENGLYWEIPSYDTRFEFHIHGSVHRESNFITVQQDATYSVYYISVGSSTCFVCW